MNEDYSSKEIIVGIVGDVENFKRIKEIKKRLNNLIDSPVKSSESGCEAILSRSIRSDLRCLPETIREGYSIKLSGLYDLN